MKKLLRAALAALSLLGGSEAFAQGSGQLPSGQLWGNCTASTATAKPSTLACIIQRAGQQPAASIQNLFPAPTRAGDLAYWNGSQWVTLPGNNSGTNVLTENSSGVPSWSSGGGCVVFGTFSVGTGAAQQCSNLASSAAIVNGPIASETGTTPGALIPTSLSFGQRGIEVSDGVNYSLSLNGPQQTFYAMGTGAGYASFSNVGASSVGPAYAWTLNTLDNWYHLIVSDTSFSQNPIIANGPIQLSKYWTYFTANVNGIPPGANLASFTGSMSGFVLNASAVTGSILPGQIIGGAGVIVPTYTLPTAVTGGTYVPGTGVVTLTLSVSLGISPGTPVTVGGATGTGSFASINGNIVAGAGSGGTTLTYTIGTGLTMTITGANAIVSGGAGPYQITKSQSVGSEAMTSQFGTFNAALAVGWNFRNLGDTDFVGNTNTHGPTTKTFKFMDWNDQTNTMTDLGEFSSPTNSATPGAFAAFFGIVGMTGAAPCTGCIGEYKPAELTNSQAVNLTNNTWTSLVTITLGNGDWDVSGNVGMCFSAAACGSNGNGNVALAAASIDVTVGQPASAAQFVEFSGAPFFSSTNFPTLPVGPQRYLCTGGNCNGTGQNVIHLNAYCGLAASPFSCAAYGKLQARRRD